MTIETLSLKYHDRKLSLIDQTLLPFKEEWVEPKSPKEMYETIKQLKVRGAPLIGVSASLYLASFAYEVKSKQEFIETALYLRESRPTAVNLMVCIDRLVEFVKETTEFSPEKIEREALQIYQEDVDLCNKIAEVGAALVKSGDVLLTHCNTGGLATAGVGTALGIIAKAHEQGKDIHVYVDETRPLLQGGRLTTWELEKLGVSYSLICDNMAGFVMKTKKVDKVFVGADRVALNGDFANKIGTYSLGVLCQYHGVEFYMAAPYTTIDFSCPTGESIPIEQRIETELRGVRDFMWSKNAGTPVVNPAFDVTPAELVTGWVFDAGFYDSKNIKDIKKLSI